MNTCILILLLGILLCSSTDALFGAALLHCKFTSVDDFVYLAQIFISKMLWGEYNSTVGKYVGYTTKAEEVADFLNYNTTFLEQEKKNLDKCKTHIPAMMELLSRLVEPSVRLRSVKATDSKHQCMLVCSAYNFYPKQIKVKWLRNGEEVTTDVTSTEELPNGNWLYQIHSYLELTPTSGESIACMVEHDSFLEPMLYEWDPISEADRTKIALGVSLFVLGLVVFVAGIIYYMRNTNGRELVPTSQPATEGLNNNK